MLDTIGKYLTARFLASPILVVGTGRSGTSVLLQGLGEHSQIFSADRESPFLPYIGALMHPFEFRHNHTYHIESLAVTQAYLYAQFRKLTFEAVFGKHYGLKKIAAQPAFFRKILGVRCWAAKTFPNETEASGLTRLFPSVKFLYIHRNGCDVVNSRMKFRGMSQISFDEQCKIWADSVQKYMYLQSMDQAFRVRQEDIATAPEETFRAIQQFIGLPYDDKPFRFSQTTLIHSLSERTRTNIDVSKALVERPKPYAAWTDNQKKTFLELCADGMHQLGYELPF